MRKAYKNEGIQSPAWARLFDPADIESLLQATAKTGRAMTYAQTLDALGMRFSRPKMRALCAALEEVDRRAALKNHPELAVLVVRASDGLPGQGWWVGRNTHDYNGPWDGPRAKEYIDKVQGKTFAFWQNHKKG